MNSKELSVFTISFLLCPDIRKQIVSSALDKSVVVWESIANDAYSDDHYESDFYEFARVAVPKGPAFSLLLQEAADEDGADAQHQLYLGTHGKEILAWNPPDRAKGEIFSIGVRLGEHCGWVRALASCSNRWLLSAACGELQVWDMARAVPSRAASASISKGDITALGCCQNRIFAAGSDGSIHSFEIEPRNGLLSLSCSRTIAHLDRITSIVCGGSNHIFTSSYDGTIKSWDPESLDLITTAENSHGGERVHCLALGPEGFLFSGGGDNLVRKWSTNTLTEISTPLHGHCHPVSALAFGGLETLASADKGGELLIWKTF